jgi:hypothetical protein
VGRLEAHHVTGRVRGKPIHGWFVFSICGPCNRAEFSLWVIAGVADENPSPAVLLRRIVLWLNTWDRPLDLDQVQTLTQALADIADRFKAA